MGSTYRERMLGVIDGQPLGPVPFAPRMDLWYIANRARGTLPAGYEGLTMAQLADVLGVACHAVRADFTLPIEDQDWALRAFGVENHPDFPYRVALRDLPLRFTRDGDLMRTEIDTSAGTVTTVQEQSIAMLRNGESDAHVLEYPIKSADDIEAVVEVFEHMEVIPTPQGYRAFHDRVGDRGIAVAAGSIAAAPIHFFLHDLSSIEQFMYLWYDERDRLLKAASRLEPFFEACLEATITSGAEVVYWGANFDQGVTWPPFFHEQLAPWLTNVGARLHAAGMALLCHTDGENRMLLPHYRHFGMDVAESVCPSPMTQLALAELRAGMPSEVTVWGGVPSVALLESSMSDSNYATFLDDLAGLAADPSRLILGVSDNVPPDMSFERLTRLGSRFQ